MFFNRHRKKGKPFNFPIAFVENKINHKGLRRLVFKDIQPRHFEDEGDFISIANMMNSLGLVPRLQQVVFGFWDPYAIILRRDLRIQTSLSFLMDRNPRLKSVGILPKYRSGGYDMRTLDALLPENKDCLVQQGGFYSEWRQVFDRLSLVDTVHFRVSLFDPLELQSLCANVLRMSPTLKKLLIVMNRSTVQMQHRFDCALILQGLWRLTELSICSFIGGAIYVEAEVNKYIISNLNVLNGNAALEYFYISLPVSETNLDAIFAIPKLKELHIKYQGSAVSFKKRHFDILTTHPRLKLIFWEKALQDKYNEFNGTTDGNKEWSFVQLRQLKPQQTVRYDGRIAVELQHEGFIFAKSYEVFAENFVLFNSARLEEHDWARIEANKKSE